MNFNFSRNLSSVHLSLKLKENVQVENLRAKNVHNCLFQVFIIPHLTFFEVQLYLDFPIPI